MEEMQILVPVSVKSKLTEALRTALINEIMQNVSRVEHDISNLISEEKEKIAEQAKINVQAIAPLRAQYEAQRIRMQQVKDKLIADKEHLEKLALGAEIPRTPMNRLVTLHIGDDMNTIMGGEILVEDGKIVAFRD